LDDVGVRYANVLRSRIAPLIAATEQQFPRTRDDARSKIAGEIKNSGLDATMFLSGPFDRVSVNPSASVPPGANASVPSRTPADRSTRLADGGSGDADTTNACPARAAAVGDVRDDAGRLVNRRWCHGLC
jgi:hypothetical protein